MNAYKSHGFPNRRAYLEDLADSTGLPVDAVLALADLLGPDEDFDGLVTACEDAEHQDLF